MELIFYGIICLFSTIIGAISGIGGGVIIKPLLDISTNMSSSEISFLSGCTVLAMSAASLIQSRKSSIKIDIKITGILALGSILGGFGGKQLFSIILENTPEPQLISIIQNYILAFLTIFVAIYIYKQNSIKTLHVTNPILCSFIGMFLGACGSFLGIGGGPINLVVLYYFFSMSTKRAALNSIFIILFSQCSSFITTFVTGSIPNVNPMIVITMVFCGVCGGIIGRRLAPKLSEKRTTVLFSVVLGLILCISIVNIIRFSII